MAAEPMSDPERVVARGFSALWAERVATTPDQVAVVGEGRTLTVAELDGQARALALAMAAQATDRRRPVLVVVGSGVDTVVCTYAGWLGGLGLARVDPRLPPLRRRQLMAAVAPQVAVVDPEHRPLLDDGIPVVDLHTPACAAMGELVPPDDAWPESLLFTSGSTGLPKGLVAPFSSRDARIAAQASCFDYGPDDRVGLNLPASFGAARTLFHAPLWGAPLHLLDPGVGGRAVGRWLDEQGITVAMLSPHLLREIIAAFELAAPGRSRTSGPSGAPRPAPTERGAEPALPRLRLVAPAADKVTGEDVEAVRRVLNPDAEVVCVYGSSEAGPTSALHVRPGGLVPGGALPVGRPVAGVEWWIDSPDETGAGAIVVRTACAASGYWNDPGLTQAVFRPDPDPRRAAAGGKVVVTGDLGRLVDGDMVLLGRRDSVVKIRGYTVDLSEVEQRLLALDEVAEARVGVDELRPGRVRIVAHVVPSRPGVTVSRLRRELSAWLPRYMLPGRVVFCDAFPRNDRGKVQMIELPAPDHHRPELDRPFAEPADELERQVAAVWSEVLGVEPIGRHDDFYDLGGDSLTMVEAIDQLGIALGADLPIAVFEDPVLSACAEACGRWRREGRPSPVLTLQPDGPGAPVFCVHGRGGRPEMFLDLAMALGGSRPFHGLQVLGTDGLARLRSVGATAAAYAAAVVEHHPQGPFVLAGYSGGGTVAVEMARQLAAAGRRPDLVVLLDAHFVSRLLLGPERIRLQSWIDAGRRRAQQRVALSPVAERVPRLRRFQNPQTVAEVREARRRLREGEPLDTVLRRRMARIEMTAGLSRWVARRYDGPVVAVCTARFSTADRWRAVVPDLTVVDVPGGHVSFIRPPQVDLVVEALAPWLAEIDAPARASAPRPGGVTAPQEVRRWAHRPMRSSGGVEAEVRP